MIEMKNALPHANVLMNIDNSISDLRSMLELDLDSKFPKDKLSETLRELDARLTRIPGIFGSLENIGDSFKEIHRNLNLAPASGNVTLIRIDYPKLGQATSWSSTQDVIDDLYSKYPNCGIVTDTYIYCKDSKWAIKISHHDRIGFINF